MTDAPAIDLVALFESLTPEDLAEAAARGEAERAEAHRHLVVDGVRFERVVDGCGRCGGTGRLPQHWRIQGGRCFACTVHLG